MEESVTKQQLKHLLDSAIAETLSNPEITYRQAAALHGVDRDYVCKVAKNYGIRRRPGRRPKSTLTAEEQAVS